eukprot:gene1174-1558_t
MPLTRTAQPDAPGPLDGGDWRSQELLLMREIMQLVGRSLAPGLVLREMLHLMSELLGLNRGRIVLADPQADTRPRRGVLADTGHSCKARFSPSAAVKGLRVEGEQCWDIPGRWVAGVGAVSARGSGGCGRAGGHLGLRHRGNHMRHRGREALGVGHMQKLVGAMGVALGAEQ